MLIASGTEIFWRVSLKFYSFTETSRFHCHRSITRYAHACGVWVVFLEHGGGALGIFKSPVYTYNQAWTFSLFDSHYFSFQSKRSGRRMPPAERSALYIRAYINIRPRYIFATLSPSQPVITGKKNICWETFLNFFAFFVSGTRMRRSGWYPRARSSQHLQVVTLHLKSWTSPPASFAFCSIFFLVSERGGRRKPPAERSALYTSTRHAHRHTDT